MKRTLLMFVAVAALGACSQRTATTTTATTTETTATETAATPPADSGSATPVATSGSPTSAAAPAAPAAADASAVGGGDAPAVVAPGAENRSGLCTLLIMGSNPSTPAQSAAMEAWGRQAEQEAGGSAAMTQRAPGLQQTIAALPADQAAAAAAYCVANAPR